MKSIVIYGSRHGNTRKVAEAIADGLRPHGTVEVLAADDAPSVLPYKADLVVVGGPTEAHRMSQPIAGFFGRLAEGALAGTSAAVFDTRLGWPRWLTGSAGAGITARLKRSGARVISFEASFLVASGAEGKPPHLLPGELERAELWAAVLAEKVDAQAMAVA